MNREEAVDLRTIQEIELRVVIVKGVKYCSEKVQTLAASSVSWAWSGRQTHGGK